VLLDSDWLPLFTNAFGCGILPEHFYGYQKLPIGATNDIREGWGANSSDTVSAQRSLREEKLQIA
jgi:hypothetical protein